MLCKLDTRKGLKNIFSKLNFFLDKVGGVCIIGVKKCNFSDL